MTLNNEIGVKQPIKEIGNCTCSILLDHEILYMHSMYSTTQKFEHTSFVGYSFVILTIFIVY